MKTIEQKAKAYDEAIERARAINNGEDVDVEAGTTTCEYIFPELRKSVDEKVRKELIKVFSNREKYLIDQSFGDITVSEALAWLEKQGEKESKKVSIWKHWKDGIAGGNEGEQIFLIKNGLHYSISSCLGYECDYIELSELDKLLSQEKQGPEPNWCHHKVDLSDCSEEYRKAYYDGWNNCNMQHEQCNAEHKLEPKFKVGDWIVRNYKDSGTFIYKVVDVKKINDESYGYKLDDGTYFSGSWEDVYHLWSIEDAKPGDILYSPEHNLLWVYKNKEECHAAVNLNYANSISFGSDIVIPSDVCPATKKQRDTIFSKMHEFGYEWDDKEKELKKIEDEEYDGEDYGIDSLWHAHRILEKTLGEVDGYQTDDGILSHKCAITAVKKLYEQKPAWSEEDRDYYDAIITKLEVTQDDAALTDNQMEFLKSLKDRVHLKQEWSEEDEIKIKSIIAFLKSPSLCAMDGNKGIIDANIKYLKSIKDRVQPQNTWKPSDEQMEALEHFIIHHNGSTNYAKDLEELRIQLKKL